jgi:hypothetical protein
VPDDDPDFGSRPWWDRALDPLRSEAAMFRVLLWVVAIAAVFIAALLIGRAVF